MAKKATTLDMSDERFEDFLNRMATDDDLRDAMKRDPHATLTGAGFRVRKESMLKKVKLPSKKEIKDKLGEYVARKQARSARVHVPHGWVAASCADEREESKPSPAPKKPKPKPQPKPKGAAKGPKKR